MRQIILDTETTGIDPEKGHRVIEIGCVELYERKLTGNNFHSYINPQRRIDEGAFRVHGISEEFLQDKPLFSDIASEFIDYLAGAELIIHNAPFDVGFLNNELRLIKRKNKLQDSSQITDTLVMAREKHPGQRNSLDALCKRYNIDNSNRQLHGALLDAEILALVYLAMTGGQASFFSDSGSGVADAKKTIQDVKPLQLENPVVLQATEEELSAHDEFINFLAKQSGTNHWG